MSDFILKRGENGVWFGHFPALSGIKHGISTRLGGVSEAPFVSLNLGLHTGDEAHKVVENRERFCQAIGVALTNVVTAQQVHGDKISVVTASEAGCGAKEYSSALAGVDAIVTNQPDLPLMLFFADCVPVIIYDPSKHVVAVSHAGWKGTVAKIAAKTISAMAAQYNVDPGDCLVAIGPSVGPCCYEVDQVVLNKLKESFAYWEQFVTPKNSKWMLDLWEANVTQLTEVGVKRQNIFVSGICTSCNTELFYSHRAEKGCTGRLGALISL